MNDLHELYLQDSKQYGFNQKWYVFGDKEPLSANTLRHKKNDYTKLAGIKQIRTHDFRHSCASLLINNGANIMIVAKYLGHAKIDETLNTYSNLFQSKVDDAVQTINQVVNENNKL